MNFLLTNDDGIEAPGIWAAARAVAPFGRVLIVAPATNYSGYGTALPPVPRLSIQRYNKTPVDLSNVVAFSVPASPATCVQVGLSKTLTKHPIDMVVSGINDTLNLGHDVIYSGTVGAALTAHLFGIRALAASFDLGAAGVSHWETATWAVGETVRSMQTATRSQSLLNLNIPNRAIGDVAGVEVTTLSNRTLLDRYDILLDADQTLTYHPSQPRGVETPEKGSDEWAIARGCLSITPLELFPNILCVAPWNGLTSRRQQPAGQPALPISAR